MSRRSNDCHRFFVFPTVERPQKQLNKPPARQILFPSLCYERTEASKEDMSEFPGAPERGPSRRMYKDILMRKRMKLNN